VKLYVLVEVFQLIVSGVYVSRDLDKVKDKFKEYTGVDYDDMVNSLEDETYEALMDDYDQTKIFEFDLEEELSEDEFLGIHLNEP